MSDNDECMCCGARLDITGVHGLMPSMNAPDLPCGCKWCWHCGDNRGRYEGHDVEECKRLTALGK